MLQPQCPQLMMPLYVKSCVIFFRWVLASRSDWTRSQTSFVTSGVCVPWYVTPSQSKSPQYNRLRRSWWMRFLCSFCPSSWRPSAGTLAARALRLYVPVANHGFGIRKPAGPAPPRRRELLVKLFILLDLPIPAGGEVVFVGLHLILGDPELAGELVYLRLQRRHTRLKFSKFLLGFLAGGTGLVSRLGDDLLKFESVDDGAVFEAVGLERGDLTL